VRLEQTVSALVAQIDLDDVPVLPRGAVAGAQSDVDDLSQLDIVADLAQAATANNADDSARIGFGTIEDKRHDWAPEKKDNARCGEPGSDALKESRKLDVVRETLNNSATLRDNAASLPG